MLVFLRHTNTLYTPQCTHKLLHDIRILIPTSFIASNSPYKGFILVVIIVLADGTHMKLHMNEALIRRIRRSKANGDKYTDVNNNVVCALVVYTVYCHDLEAFVLCTPRYH